MAATDLTFDLFARDRSVTKTFDSIDKSASRTRNTLSALGTGIAGTAKAVGAIGAAAGAGLFIFAKGAIAEAREAEKVGKTTAQIIKSTGGAAKISADQVGELAEKLSLKAGVDDEVIQTGANLLLTFKNVRNEAGKGAKIFDRATTAAVDLSAAGFGSVDSASKMLGKALNDPLKGITALSRAGVTFTEQQKEQIAAMVESGNILGAQKLILKEVESQVGGVAAANATLGDKARVAWGNIQEAVGERFLPIWNKVLEGFLAALPHIDKIAAVVIGKLGPAFRTAAQFLNAFINGLKGGTAGGAGPLVTITNLGGKLRTTFQQALPVIKQTAAQFIQLGRVAAPYLGQAFTVILAVLRQVFTVVGPIIGQIRQTLIGVFRRAAPEIRSSMESIREIVVGVLAIVQKVWQKFGPTVLAVVRNAFGTIFKVISGVLQAVAGVVKLVLAIIRGDWKGAWAAIKQITAGLWKAIHALVVGSIRQMRIILTAGWTAIKAITSRAWAGIKSAVSSAVSRLLGVVRGIPGQIRRGLGNLGSLLYNAGRDVIRGLINGIRNMAGSAVSAAKGVVGDAVAGAKNLLGIRSPSKVFHRIGEYVGEGLVRGILSKSRSVNEAAGRLAKVLTARADEAKKQFTEILRTRNEFARSVRDNAVSFGSIMGVEEVKGASDITRHMASRLTTMKKFTAMMSNLRKMGLNDRTFREMIEAGPEAAFDQARFLQHGGRASVNRVNSLARQIGAASSRLGRFSASSLYADNLRDARREVRVVLDLRGGDSDMRRLIRKWIRNDNLLQGAR